MYKSKISLGSFQINYLLIISPGTFPFHFVIQLFFMTIQDGVIGNIWLHYLNVVTFLWLC